MTEDDIIAAKRSRVESNVINTTIDMEVNSWTIKAILPDEFCELIPRFSVYIAHISNMKTMSKVMNELCQLMPLKALNHLKRVNKSRLILCPIGDIRIFFLKHIKQDSIQEFLTTQLKKQHVPTEDELKDFNGDTTVSFLKFYMQNLQFSSDIIEILSEKIEIVDVAVRPPVLSWQYADVIKDWPCKFYPNKNLEQLFLGQRFSNTETAFHKKILAICGFLCNRLRRDTCGIVVDPRTKSIVAVGFDAIDRHPLMHCTMVLIDAVARSQCGGAWNSLLLEHDNTEIESVYASKCSDTDEYTMSGVSCYIRQLIHSKFESVTFGAEKVKLATENRENCLNRNPNGDNLTKYGPYLCTGYDVYLWREPCVMCSMALTHSRSRTIFFHEKRRNGAICSSTKLQSLKALNHHFQVFHIATN